MFFYQRAHYSCGCKRERTDRVMQLTLTIDTAHGLGACAQQVADFARVLAGGAAKPAGAVTGATAATPPKAGASAAPTEPAKGKGGRPTKEEQARKAAEAAAAAKA